MGHVFISYSHSDTKYAHALADHLQSMGFDVWIDERLRYGSQWAHEIETRLDSCDAFILVMTPRSFASPWVQNELQRAQRKGKPVFPLLLEGEPSLSVESIQYYDVRNGNLPGAKFYTELKQAISVGPNSITFTSVPKPPRKEGVPKNRTNYKSALIFTGLSAAAFVAVCVIVFVVLQLMDPPLSPTLALTDSLPTAPTEIQSDGTSVPSPTQLFTASVEVAVQPSETQTLLTATQIPPTATSTSTRLPSDTPMPPTSVPTDTPIPPTPVPDTPLYNWWSPSREDNFASTAWIGSLATKSPDYSYFRLEGYVFSPDLPQPAGTVPLYKWYSPSRGDNFTTTGWSGNVGDIRSPDYHMSRIEGYIHDPNRPQPPGTVPLYTWWSDSRKDNSTTTMPVWSTDLHLTKSPDYRFVRLEGYIRQP